MTTGIQQEMQLLYDKLRLADRAYYVDCEPIMDDFDYDRKCVIFKKLVEQHPEEAARLNDPLRGCRVFNRFTNDRGIVTPEAWR